MISDFGEDPRLGSPLISGGPNLLPPEVLRFFEVVRTALVSQRGSGRHGTEQRGAALRRAERRGAALVPFVR